MTRHEGTTETPGCGIARDIPFAAGIHVGLQADPLPTVPSVNTALGLIEQPLPDQEHNEFTP